MSTSAWTRFFTGKDAHQPTAKLGDPSASAQHGHEAWPWHSPEIAERNVVSAPSLRTTRHATNARSDPDSER